MHEPVAVTPRRTFATLAQLSSDAADALCSAIAGFALLAGARAFTFTALLGWREPVLGGAGLVLLALVGWLRWRCGAAGLLPSCAKARNVACYNRLKQCDSSDSTCSACSPGGIGEVECRLFGRARTRA